jgi:hypothetical protein
MGTGSSDEKSSPAEYHPEHVVPPVDPNRVELEKAETEREKEKSRRQVGMGVLVLASAIVIIGGLQASAGNWSEIRGWWGDVFPWITGALGFVVGRYFGKPAS